MVLHFTTSPHCRAHKTVQYADNLLIILPLAIRAVISRESNVVNCVEIHSRLMRIIEMFYEYFALKQLCKSCMCLLIATASNAECLCSCLIPSNCVVSIM